MRVEWYKGVNGFDVLRAEWDELLQRSATDVPFLTWGWQQAWWNAFAAPLQGGKDLRLLAVRDESGHLKGIAPLFTQETVLDSNARLPGISVENPLVTANGQVRRTVHLVGGTEVSDYLDIIVPPESHQEVTAAFLDALAGEEGWQILDLRPLPSASPTVAAIMELARERGWDVQQAREDVCPVLELPGTWEEYLATKLSKKRRHELRRKMRRAEREAQVDWYWVDADDLEEGMDVFIRLHKASALDKEAFMDDRMEGFFRAVARFALEEDWLRLSVLRFDGQAVASYLCFDYAGDRLVYNSGFDLSTYHALSPGIVLLGYLIADAIERGCQRFDFLQGDERYKYDLGGTDTEVLRLFIRR